MGYYNTLDVPSQTIFYHQHQRQLTILLKYNNVRENWEYLVLGFGKIIQKLTETYLTALLFILECIIIYITPYVFNRKNTIPDKRNHV